MNVAITEFAPHIWISGSAKAGSADLSLDRLYKIISLAIAARAGVPVPDTLAILDRDMRTVGRFVSRWVTPILRMDFVSRPKRKFLGGISISSRASLNNLILFLKDNGYCPILHPYMNRYQNIYSAGVLLQRQSSVIQVELVGAGFDAGDLRLGLTNPYESLEIDLDSGRVRNRQYASQNAYEVSRRRRLRRRLALRAYTEYANIHGRLRWKIDDLVGDYDEPTAVDRLQVPETYTPIPTTDIESLTDACRPIIRVIEELPQSVGYVASLSLFDRGGWLLWDIYGQWYER